MKLNKLRAWIFLAYLLLSLSALAFRAPDRPPLPNFDTRTRTIAADSKPLPTQSAAAAKLRSTVPGSRIDFDALTSGPKFVSGGPGFLTGANGAGKAVRPEAAKLFASDPHGPAKAFIQSQRDLFGFGPEALDSAQLKRDSFASHNGVRTAVWQQQVNGIPVFEARFVAHTTKRGELITVSSGFIRDPLAAAKRAQATPLSPVIDAAQALASAAQNVGEETKPDQVRVDTDAAAGDPTKYKKLRAQGVNGQADASLIWIPLDPETLTLAWEIVFTSHSRGEMFQALVDAQTGKVIVRRCLTEYLTEASYQVYTSDSPSPFSPGWQVPNSSQPATIARELVTVSALDTNASPAGWIPDGGNETLGNNVDAHSDTNGDDVADLPRPQGSPDRVFDFPLDLATGPGAYRSAAIVQLFYWNNWMHDKLYELGFDEAAGNFQNLNFGRGGLGNDAVQADAQDASDTDNANFSTPTDGSPPRMQMFIFAKPNPQRDGDLDAEIVLHEYTHGLSNRHVNGGGGLNWLQSRGMGEGWSDFYALALLSHPDDNANAAYAAGAYASYMLGGSGDTMNYYFGIRRYPYCTDLTKNPLTFKDIDPAQADFCSSGAPFHSGMFGSCSATSADEVHNIGEVWCVALWEARANMINKYGWAVGNQLILQLVTDGMLYAPANPNFVQARDGILAADMADNAGANLDELWAAFAKRGLGFSATSPSGTTVSGVHESYDMPDDLRIHPAAGFIANGPVGGPFNVSSQTFQLTNFGANPLSWHLVNNAPWLTISPADGSLTPGGPAASVNVALNGVANGLAPGVYNASVLLTNINSGAGQQRDFMLRVGQPDYFTELFEAHDNDLAYTTLTFTPNGSSSFYAVCRETAAAFPTDPTGGTAVNLTDDSFAQVNLNGASVSLYGHTSSSFFIGSNGYLTMNSGDNSWTESISTHFDRPRISALFHDQLPVNNTVISWKQLADRVAVTYQNLSDINETGLNDFQIEWFYDARIRLTYLRVTEHQNLVGLSAGTGIPFGFIEMDLGVATSCNPLQLAIPAQVHEGDGVLANAGTITLPVASPTNVVLALSSSDTAEVSVPPTLVVPAGETVVSFDLTVLDDVVLDGTQPVTLTVSGVGLGSASQILQVSDNEKTTLNLAAPASAVEGQGTASGLVTLSAPPAKTVTIGLISSDTNALVVPANVFVPAGQTSVSFVITVLDNKVPNAAEDVKLTAHVENWTDGVAIVHVLDNPIPLVVGQNPNLIIIPDSGPAVLYPSTITIAGAVGLISQVTVTVSNLFHTYPDDVGIMLVGPTGTNLVLLANAGGGTDASGVTLTFDDTASSRVPDGGPLTSGVYLPTSISPATWPAPAPATSPASMLSIFNGTNPNGDWKLYVYDDSSVDGGRINDGWFLSIQTTNPTTPAPVLMTPVLVASNLSFSFATLANHAYIVEYADAPNALNWNTLQAMPGDGTVKTFTDTTLEPQRFYRVRVQ